MKLCHQLTRAMADLGQHFGDFKTLFPCDLIQSQRHCELVGQNDHSPSTDKDRSTVVPGLAKAAWFQRDSGLRDLPASRSLVRFIVGREALGRSEEGRWYVLAWGGGSS